MPPSGQPPYINGVAALEGNIPADHLLAQLHAIEQLAGRQRSVPNAARTLDLDLIDHHGQICATPGLTLPHPRAHLRAFVLLPIQDIAPDWRHPTLHRTAAELLADLPPQQIAPLTLAQPTPIL